MSNQNFDKNNDVESKTPHKETRKPQDLDIERKVVVLSTGKGSFESEKSCKNSYDFKGEKVCFFKKQELLNTAPKAPNDRNIEETILLSAKEPSSRADFHQNSKQATTIRGEDQDSYPKFYITNLDDRHQQEPLKANSSGLRSHSFALKFQIDSVNSLQDLDLKRCLLGKHAIQVICSNYNLKSLKSLNLTQNPINKDSVKFVSETSNWPKLQRLILSNTKIDYDGVKWLAINESWTSLKELDLSENPLIGDLGAMNLCLNRTWRSLKTLSLWGCKVGTLGVIVSRRHRNYTVLFAKDKTTIESENQNFSFQKVSFRTTPDTQNPDESLLTYPFIYSNRRFQNFKSKIRGGSPQGDGGDGSSDIDYLALLTKFQQYKEKILNDTSIEKELKLFIEVQARTIPANHHGTNNENSSDVSQHLELSFDLRRNLLYCEGSKILLLTGQAGSGKSLFCKHLQRELLSDWSQKSESEDRNWFPIYVELSSLKNPKSEAISETLSRELSLTSEEIFFLEATEQSNLCMLRLLFIFDGYDTIEDFHALHSLSSRDDFMKHNFSVLNKINGTKFKDAKFIITCREEDLQKVQRRDLIFAPINTESSELPVASESLLQRKIEPFSDEQITCYLKKYYYHESKNIAEQGSSWNQVNVFENMLDNYQLREIARIPFMLWIMCQVLPNLITNKSEQIDGVEFILPHRLSRRFVIECFLDKVIRSMTRESLNTSYSFENKERHKITQKTEEEDQQLNLHLTKIRQQVQTFALESKGYTSNKSTDERDQHHDLSVLKIHPIATWDNSNSRGKFDHPLLLEFLVAKSIEEEIREIVPSILDESLKIKKGLLIDQKLLTSKASDEIVIFFLIDAIKDERLTATQFINIIYPSRQRELDQEHDGGKIPRSTHASPQLPFAIAASNAITVLNASGHNFSHQDLSNVNITHANLSSGGFEGTKFTNANLERVNFTGAWLRDANFAKANLESVEFGAIRRLKLQNEKIKNIAYSPDGEYFAADVGAKTVIFENVGIRKFCLEEKRRFPGYFLSWGGLDGTKVVTIVGERILTEEKQSEEAEEDNGKQELQDDQKEKLNVCFCIWDAISGQSIEKFNVPIGDKRFLSFNSERKEVIALDNRNVQKYDITSQSWIQFPVKVCKGVKTRNLFARNSNTLLVGDYLGNTILYSLITGKAILKQRQEVTSYKLSPDGQKIVAGASQGFMYISDCVRGYILKSLLNQSTEEEDDDDESKTLFDCSFNADGKQILSRTGKRLTLQDVADFTLTYLPLPSAELNSHTYCLCPYGQQIAVVEEMDTISFKKIPTIADLSIQAPAIRGTNNKGLNLLGVIANNSVNLSEENIAVFHEKGDYKIFNETMMKKLFSNSSTNSEDVKEVVLLRQKLASIHARIIGSDLLWINLQRLDLSRNDIGEEGGKAIGSNITWANLEELILIRSEIGNETAKAIANNQKLQKLKKLLLAFNKIGDIGAQTIGNNKLWIHLEILDLRQNMIKADGALAIGANSIWKKLVTFDMSSNQISDKHILIFLCRNKTWENLQSLLLVGNPTLLETNDICKILQGIASKSLKMLVLPQAKFEQALLQCLKYSALENVINLSLAKNGYNNINAEIIAADVTFTNLKKLDLSKNLIGDKGGIKIGSNTSWINLEELYLSENNLGAQTAIAIGDNTTWSKFRVLNLNSNKIGSEGSYAIGNNKTWIKLQTLELQDNLIGSKGVSALCQNKTWTKLQALNLEKNLIDVDGARELTRNTSWINLQTLDLGYNPIGAEGVAELARKTSWINLRALKLNDSSIGAEGAAELAKNISWINLQAIDLRNNSIGAEGAAELARNSSWINLQILKLNDNSIGDKGAAELAKNLSWIDLQALNLNKNSIGAEGAAELARNASWVNLQTLDLGYNSICDKGAAELARNTSWINLQTLTLDSNKIGAEGATELARNTSWIKLQTLNLTDNSIGAEGAAELARNTSWVNLQTLNLFHNSIRKEGAADLGKNASWINLETLGLTNNSIGAEGASELSRNARWINLKALNLDCNSIGAEGVAELARNTSWINLQTLELGYNSIGVEGAAVLARNESWINLQKLGLRNNSIGNKGTAELGKNTSWANLQTLDLGYNSIGAEGAAELARNTSWFNLQTLNLYKNSIDAEAVAELARNTSWINLQILDLGCNSIGAEGAAELARNTPWINLQTLNLHNNSIGDKGAAELSRNTSWINLQTLDLEDNSIGAEGASELARNTSWINLQTLDLGDNSIGDKGAAELAKNTSWNNLQALNLYKNSIGDKGAAELAKNTSWSNLQALNLYKNSIGAEGAAELARNTSWINLQTLDLRINWIGAEGAADLARNTSWINLQTLDLSYNWIGAEGAAELARNTSWIKLQTLNLYDNSIGAEEAAELGKNATWPKTLKISY